jgi:uncharacterized membrane protein YcaP (DUF421 family)
MNLVWESKDGAEGGIAVLNLYISQEVTMPFFESWEGIRRVLMLGTAAYLGLIIMLRVSGKRTLSKMNSFDFVVTVALGSTLSSIIISKSVALAEGLTALVLLILLQFLITWTSVRSRFVRTLVKNEPVLLVRNGEILQRTCRQERITKEEILQAIRNQQLASLSEVDALILETDGTLNVLTNTSAHSDAMNNVQSHS